MTRQAGVIGSPIGHSLSPAIFRAAFAAAGLDWAYDAYEVSAGGAARFLTGEGAELVGISVTMPLKAEVIPALDELDPVAAELGAVNCIVRLPDGRRRGHNTDGAGFLDALRAEADVDVAGLRCVVLGAGGAGRAVALALRTGGAAEVVVVNRSPARAREAAALIGPAGRVGGPSDVGAADVVVNTTSVGMGTDANLPVDASVLHAAQTVVDIVYHPVETPLLTAARAAGARAVGGLGMLVHQAAHAFELWVGAAAPLDAMRSGAMAALEARDGVA